MNGSSGDTGAAGDETKANLVQEPVVGWVIIKEEVFLKEVEGEFVTVPEEEDYEKKEIEIYPEPMVAPRTDNEGSTPFEELAVLVEPDQNQEVVEIIPDTTGGMEVSSIEDTHYELLGYHYSGATSPNWDEIRAEILKDNANIS
jgi:hypothetical protein